MDGLAPNPANCGRALLRAGVGLYGLLVAAAVVWGLPLFTGLDYWGRGDWDQFSFRYGTARKAWLDYQQLPTWNPYVNGGNVLLAHPHSPALSPLFLPVLVLGVPLGLRVQVVLFAVLGLWGMAALLRRLNVSWAGAFLGGVLLMLSTHFLLHITEGHQEWCALGLVPWMAWCLLRAEADRRWLIGAGLVFALALMHGSIYVAAVFAPLGGVWAGLESLRRRRWGPLVGWLGAVLLAAMFAAVVLLPRIEFVHANPRPTDRYEQIALRALPRMLLDPRQGSIYRATRDVRNPPYEELARLLPDRADFFRHKAATRQWHRLDVQLSTTSDWTDLRFENFPYLLRIEDPAKHEPIPPRRLDSLPLSTEGLALKNSQPDSQEISLQAVLYVRLPRRGDLRFVITRGNVGRTRLLVRRGETKLLDVVHERLIPGAGDNRREFVIPRQSLLFGELPPAPPGERHWYCLQAVLSTTADWCALRIEELPYLFAVEPPAREARQPQPLATAPLAIRRAGGLRAPLAQRAMLYVACADGEQLRAVITQGRLGSSRLELRTPGGRPLAARCTEHEELGGQKTYEYLLPAAEIQQHLAPAQEPLRWRLDELGMVYDWHEYGCYPTWIGLGLAVVGLAAAGRRAWPLWLMGLTALWIALGAGVPISAWGWMKFLPLYASLQVSARFLMGLVFVLAVAAPFGLDACVRAVQRAAGMRAGTVLGWVLALLVYGELLALGWNLLGDIFVCPPRSVPAHPQFAQRYAAEEVRYAAMYSAHYPYLEANSGVLRQYENIAIPRGSIRLAGTPDYRGEAWLAKGHGTAVIRRWTMAQVSVDLELAGDDLLVLNQNYFPGWKAVVRSAAGPRRKLRACRGEGSEEGLVAVPVQANDCQVVFYYLPDTVVWGAVLSGVSLAGACVVLLVGSRRLKLAANGLRGLLAALPPAAGTRLGRLVCWAVVLNLPFVLAHPSHLLLHGHSALALLARSLAINCVLLLVPGMAWSRLMAGRSAPPAWRLPGVVLGSLGTLLGVLLARHAAGLPLAPAGMWNATWLVSNAALLGAAARDGLPGPGAVLRSMRGGVSLPLFVAAYALFFIGATRIVPPMQDHDLDLQGPGYGLLVRLEPRVVNDRGLLYYFAHPLLLNTCQAASFLYWGQFDYLARFDQTTERVIWAESAQSAEPLLHGFRRLPDGRLVRADSPQRGGTLHRIIGLKQGEYLVTPPLVDQGERIAPRQLEVQLLYDDYHRDPRRLESRTVNIFLAALAVALLGWWITGQGGPGWAALLVPAVYATSPEVFVRSSYGGYFAATALGGLMVVLAVEQYAHTAHAMNCCTCGGLNVPARRAADWRACLWAGLFAGLSNNKLLPLAVAVAGWELLCAEQGSIEALGKPLTLGQRLTLGKPLTLVKRLARAAAHPAVLGFLLATAAFVAYGAAIDWPAFCADYLRHHLIDRVVHHNPLGYQGYPSVAGLWWELIWHTGYVLLPLGAAALGVLCWQDCRGRAAAALEPDVHRTPGEKEARAVLAPGGVAGRQSSGPTASRAPEVCELEISSAALWAIWAVLTAVAFSLIDWRQTKHLIVLLLPAMLALALWAIRQPKLRVAVGVVLAGVLCWNLGKLWLLAEVFSDFAVTPAW